MLEKLFHFVKCSNKIKEREAKSITYKADINDHPDLIKVFKERESITKRRQMYEDSIFKDLVDKKRKLTALLMTCKDATEKECLRTQLHKICEQIEKDSIVAHYIEKETELGCRVEEYLRTNFPDYETQTDIIIQMEYLK